MANRLTGNIRVIDTFGADVVVASGHCKVIAILATGYTSAKTVTFIDSEGSEVMRFEVPADGTNQFTPASPIHFHHGITFDDSESDFAANDLIFLYVE